MRSRSVCARLFTTIGGSEFFRLFTFTGGSEFFRLFLIIGWRGVRD
jgi:hypothetical protein